MEESSEPERERGDHSPPEHTRGFPERPRPDRAGKGVRSSLRLYERSIVPSLAFGVRITCGAAASPCRYTFRIAPYVEKRPDRWTRPGEWCVGVRKNQSPKLPTSSRSSCLTGGSAVVSPARFRRFARCSFCRLFAQDVLAVELHHALVLFLLALVLPSFP